jgi:L-alanine-DL-glutamate epimerase-like enolase superfamily enzyme
MHITALRATPVAVPFTRPESWAFGERTGMVSVLLEVDTDEGLVGLGEAAAYPSAEIIEAVLRSIEPLVLGETVFNIERIMKRINIVGTWHHVAATSPAIAAVEMALWDLVGKVSSQPVVNLFGGRVRDEVEYFYYLTRSTPEQMAADAAAGYERGFRTFYLKACANDPADDIERVEAVHGAIGARAGIRVDANEAWSPAAAIRIIKDMERFGLELAEQPVSGRNLDEMAYVRSRINVPLLANEAWSPAAAIRIIKDMERFGLELAEQPVSGRNLDEMAYVRSRINVPLLANEASWTRYHHLEIIKHGAADVVSVDNQMDGGLGNLKIGAAMCEVAGLPVLKHSLGELGVATYAGAHLLASIPNALFASQAYGSLLADDVIEGASPLPYRDGRLAVPTGPGLGVMLDAERVGRYADAYRADPSGYSFHDQGSLEVTPVMPKF